METSVKAGRAALLSVVMLLLLAGPAQAAGVRGVPAVTVPVVLAAAKPWHYWISFVLAASFLGLLFMMLVGYVVKVVMLKYGIRVGRKST
jgi:thiosulfate reductase cytochrome b subunit